MKSLCICTIHTVLDSRDKIFEISPSKALATLWGMYTKKRAVKSLQDIFKSSMDLEVSRS